ncbi:MAG: hypothetical protein WC454_01975 [Phycisphaerae bacterium]|jgi:hypothetical protein
MNTFWLKIAAIAVVVAVVIVLIGVFSSSERPQPLTKETVTEPVNKPVKNFPEQVEKDREKFLSPPKQPVNKPAEEPVKQQVQEQNQPADSQTPSQPVQPPAQPAQLYFSPLSEIDNVEAERLLNVAVPGRSIGRLPMTGYKLMVDTCRQIISKWPDSWYAYNAKKMLIDMPVRFRERYQITQQELDISEFTKQRPGTELFNGTVEEESP